MRYFLSRKEHETVEESKKSFCTRKFRKKEDVFGYVTTNSLRKVASVT